MIKNIFYFLIVSSVTFLSASNLALKSFEWAKFFQGNGNEADQFTKMAVDPNGNVIAVGTTVDSNDVPSWFIVKLNSNGDEIWRKTLTSDSTNYASTIAIDTNGSFYVGGGTDDWIIKKFDSNGNEIPTGWNKTIVHSGKDQINSMIVNSNHELYVAGYATNQVSSNSGTDWLIKKYSSTGTELWTHSYNSTYAADGSSSDSALSIDVDLYNNVEYVIVGGFIEDDIVGKEIAYIRRLNPGSGAMLDGDLLSTSDESRITAIQIDQSSGNYYAGGYVENDLNSDGYSDRNSYGIVYKRNLSDGSVIWSDNISYTSGGKSDTYYVKSIEIANNYIYVAGYGLKMVIDPDGPYQAYVRHISKPFNIVDKYDSNSNIPISQYSDEIGNTEDMKIFGNIFYLGGNVRRFYSYTYVVKLITDTVCITTCDNDWVVKKANLF